jgi:hypothetical protein
MVFKSTIIAGTIAGLMAVCNLQLAVAEPVKAKALAERATPRPDYYQLFNDEQDETDDFDLVDDNSNVIESFSQNLHKRDFTLTKRDNSCSKTYRGKYMLVSLSEFVLHTGFSTYRFCLTYNPVKDVDTCISVSKKFGLSLSEFYALNTNVDSHCTNLLTGKN